VFNTLSPLPVAVTLICVLPLIDTSAAATPAVITNAVVVRR
jgi:hypothetical protein